MGLLMNELGEFVEPDVERDERKALYGSRRPVEKSTWLPLGTYRVCAACGRRYMPKSRQQRFCSRACFKVGKASERRGNV